MNKTLWVLGSRLLFSWVMRLRIFRLLTAVGLGAAAAYLLDPESGEKRRKELRKGIQKAKKMGRKARIEAGL